MAKEMESDGYQEAQCRLRMSMLCRSMVRPLRYPLQARIVELVTSLVLSAAFQQPAHLPWMWCQDHRCPGPGKNIQIIHQSINSVGIEHYRTEAALHQLQYHLDGLFMDRDSRPESQGLLVLE